ncbi:uncharacterized protein LOC136096747 [Hydra vulgaris]|uniref:uncharacterized protein LOC136096747 n=1 Tax=Hydra vulgaris TaxID=6087 RepID=UPI0032EA459D
MKNAVDELIPAGETSRDIMCSFDGSWQKRGFTSNNGVVSAISVESGKCIDFQIEKKTCKLCSIWKLKKYTHPVKYEKFQSSHFQKCKISHIGSSSAMESSGVLKLFHRSEKKTISRCIGHIQKRVGPRLRNLKKSSKEILTDGKKLGGAGRLTENVINALQNYYGKAIRQNTGSLCAMKKSEAASFSLAGKITGKKTYKENICIPAAVRDFIKPIFIDLGSDVLLEKCLHGKTQNPNEALNPLIWKRCPKDIFVERTALCVGVASAVLYFNNGLQFLETLFDKLEITVGCNLHNFCLTNDSKRISKAEKQCTSIVKLRRKKLRAIHKGFCDQNETLEGAVYGALNEQDVFIERLIIFKKWRL